MTPLAAWSSRHAELEVLARDVWCAVADGDPAFGAALVVLDAALRQHAGFEDLHVLPVWASCPAPPNATAAVLRADHDRLRALLDTLGAASDPVDRAEAAALLLEVLDHHDRREASSVVPHLDALDPDRAARWVAAARAEEGRLPPRRPPPCTRRGPPTDDVRRAVATDAPLELPELPVPDHPKGARRRDAVRDAARAVADAPDGRARREALRALWGAWRLYGLVRAISPTGPTPSGPDRGP